MVLEYFPDFDKEPAYLGVLADPLESTVAQGAMPVPTKPGLGVTLQHAALQAHHYARCRA